MRTTFLLAVLVALAGCDSNDPEVRLGDAVDPDNPDQCLVGDLVIEDLVETSAQEAGPTRTVVVDYEGTFPFDGGTERFDGGQNVAFPLTNTVRGFRDGIGGRAATDDAPAVAPMRIGERRLITIPPNLAYGFTGRYNQAGEHIIPRCATLTFDVTLRDLR